MIPPGGGFAGDHRPPLFVQSSSMWSTLSPFSVPFDLNELFAPATNPSRPPPPPADDPTVHRPYVPPLPPAPDQSYLNLRRAASSPYGDAYPGATAASLYSRDPMRGSESSSSTATIAAPLNEPLSSPAIGSILSASIDEAVEPLPDSEWCTGVNVGQHNGLLDGAQVTGTAAEGFMACQDAWGPSHGKLVDSKARKCHFGSGCLDDKYPENSEEGVSAPCNISEVSLLGTSAVHNGLPSFHSPDNVSMIDACNDYNSNPSYDRYDVQLASCSTDTMVYSRNMYYSAQAYAPSARRFSSSIDRSASASTYSALQHPNPDDDCPYYIVPKRKGPIFNQNAESKEKCLERNIESTNKETVVGLPSRDKEFQNANEKGSDGNDKGSQYSDVLRGHSTTVLNCQKRDPGPKDCDVKQLGHDGVASADQPILADETSLETGFKAVAQGKYSPLRRDVQLLVEIVHDLLEELMNYGDAGELDELEHELVQIAIVYIEAFILKKKKVTVSNADCKSTEDVSETVTEDFERSKVLENAPMAHSNKLEENLQTLLYRNLWREAETKLYTLKNELQLAELKLEILNREYQNSANSHHSSESTSKCISLESPRYTTSTLGDEVDKSSCEDFQVSDSEKLADEVDASDMERFEVLEARCEESSSESAAEDDEQKPTVGSYHPLLEDYFRMVVQPTDLNDWSFIQTETEARGGILSAENWSDELFLDEGYVNGNGLSPNVSDLAATRESQVYTPDGQLNQYDNPSSEWEHVSEEELTGYNNP